MNKEKLSELEQPPVKKHACFCGLCVPQFDPDLDFSSREVYQRPEVKPAASVPETASLAA